MIDLTLKKLVAEDLLTHLNGNYHVATKPVIPIVVLILLGKSY